MEKQINFWSRFAFLNKHLIFLRSLKEPFGGILANISNCRALSPFETVPGSLIRNVKFPSCRQPNDIIVCTSSENLSPKKTNKFLESVDIL